MEAGWARMNDLIVIQASQVGFHNNLVPLDSVDMAVHLMYECRGYALMLCST